MIEPSAVNPWADDLLARSQEAQMLKHFLIGRIVERQSVGKPRSFVLNIDAQWGTGKTYFLDRFAEQLVNEGFLVARVNAWEDDYVEDPLISVLEVIESAVEPFLSGAPAIAGILQGIRSNGVEIAVSLARGTIATLGRKFIGEAVDGIPDLVSAGMQNELENALEKGGEAAFDTVLDNASKAIIGEFRQKRKAARSFKKRLGLLTSQLGSIREKHRQIFVFVDELDRCRPTYAIQMLERIKQLFEADGIVFVLATDTSQLQHSIKAIYGESFNSHRYLLRFFDRQYRFRESSALEFVRQLRSNGFPLERISIPPMSRAGDCELFDVYFTKTAESFGASLRDIRAGFELIADFATSWPHKSKIEACYLFPLIFLRLCRGVNLNDLNRSRVAIDEVRRCTDWEVNTFVAANGVTMSKSAFDYFLFCMNIEA
jgi:hypothetical protein